LKTTVEVPFEDLENLRMRHGRAASTQEFKVPGLPPPGTSTKRSLPLMEVKLLEALH
jgi:hypothetical protein